MLRKSIRKEKRMPRGDKIPWPVRITECEDAIRKQDHWAFKNNAKFVDEIVAATEAGITKEGRMESLKFLCDQGCPRRELLYLLGMCENRGVTKSVKVTGFDSEDLKRQLNRVRKCASIIEAINGRQGQFGHLLYSERGKRYQPLCKLLLLPSVLRDYVALVRHAVDFIGGKSDFYLHLAKSGLVYFVYRHTKEFHDQQVVDLLSVKLGENYSAEDHRNWRSKYLKRRKGYQPERTDLLSGQIRTILLDMQATVLYRMDILHSGKKYLRQDIPISGQKDVRPKRHTVTRPE